MKNSPSAAALRRLDKPLFEAGQQCLKRLYLDYHSPVREAPSESRRTMSETGHRLLALARSAFPRGIEVGGEDLEEAARRTTELLAAEGTAVIFGAAFVTDDVEVRTDIVLRQKDGRLDLFEVKSGTRVKARHLTDLALQVHAIEQLGMSVRAMHVLHLDRTFTAVEGEEPAPTKLFRSADVTERVRRIVPRIGELVQSYRRQLNDDSALQLPTGTFCTSPFRCPHLDDCARAEPKHPLRHLPDLTRQLEAALHEEGIDDLQQLDQRRRGLTFRQRRTLQAVQQGQRIVEPFVRDELRQTEYPLHFLAMATVTEPLPRHGGMHPWQPLYYAFAVETVHEDGRTVQQSFAHTDKGDPRPPLIRALGAHLGGAGMVICWCREALAGVRELLDALPGEKQMLRAILARPHLDLGRLLESGLFDPRLPARRTLTEAAAVLLDEEPDPQSAIRDEDAAFAAVQRAWAPRVRATTREKIATDLQEWLRWQARTVARLHALFAELPRREPAPEPESAPEAVRERKPLPPE